MFAFSLICGMKQVLQVNVHYIDIEIYDTLG